MREGDQRFFSMSFFYVDVCRCVAEVVKRVYIRLMGYDWRPEKGVGFGLTLDRRIRPFLTHQIKPSRKYSARYRFYVPKCCILALEFHLDFLGLTWNGAQKPSNTVFSPLPPPGVGPGWRGLVGRLFSSFYGWSDLNGQFPRFDVDRHCGVCLLCETTVLLRPVHTQAMTWVVSSGSRFNFWRNSWIISQ